MFGAADYAADFRGSAEGIDASRARAVIANAAAMERLVAIDLPFLSIDGGSALAARGLGVNAKAAIHLKQVAAIGDSFSPESRRGRARDPRPDSSGRGRGVDRWKNDRHSDFAVGAQDSSALGAETGLDLGDSDRVARP